MTTAFPVFAVRRDPDGRETITEITTPSLYIDTSDLSYLLLGRKQRDSTGPIEWRMRLQQLLVGGRVRLRISAIHLAELALRSEVLPVALAAIETTPNIFFTWSEVGDVFEAELRRERVILCEEPAAASELRDIRLPVRGLPISLPGHWVARLVKGIVRLDARARSLGKHAHRSAPVDREVAQRILAGDMNALPPWLRVPARLGLSTLSRLAEWYGLPDDAAVRMLRREGRGFGWTATMPEEPRLPRRDNKKWRQADAEAMPATVLRSCIEKMHADPNKPADARAAFDIQHLAFVAYSDFSTVDKENHDAVKSALPVLPKLNIYRTGNLGPLLDAVEQRVAR